MVGQFLPAPKWCLAAYAYAVVGRTDRFFQYTRSGGRLLSIGKHITQTAPRISGSSSLIVCQLSSSAMQSWRP